MQTTIYALCEPGTRQVRYIGCSIHPMKRIAQHAKVATPVGEWLRILFASGRKPHLRIIEILGGEAFNSWAKREGHWIAHEAAKPDSRLLNRVYLVSLDEGYDVSRRFVANGERRVAALHHLRDMRRERQRRIAENCRDSNHA